MLGGTVLGCVVAVLVISASVTPGLPAASGFLCRDNGGFRAHNVTFKEGLSLSTSSGGPDPSKECTFVAELLHSSRAGWAVVQHHDGGGRHYYLGNDEAGVPRNEKTMDALMGAAIRLFEEDLPATSTVVSFEPYSVRVELKEGLVEALRTYQAPHSPMWVRMQDRQGHVRELHFRPDSVSDLPVSEENHLMTLRELQTTSELAETVDHGVGLCRWAQQRSSSARRSKRQTEVVVINRRKKHHDGNGAAVAIGLGVGLGVGIPVVVLLALIPCVIALWLIMKRRRGSRTIRVADVPTGVFATGPPRDDTTRRQADVQEEEEVEPDYQGSDLPYSLEDNY